MGCVLYEMMNLQKAFIKQQTDDPSLIQIPNLGDHLFFSPILKKYTFTSLNI